MPDTDAKKVATACLEAWTSGDFATARSLMHDDITFTGPLGVTTGADAYIEGVQGFAAMVDRVDIHEVIAEGDDVCVQYDLVAGAAGAMPTVGWYEVHDGLIRSVRAFFDPRPMLSP
ncbi:MAG TPA: nuclear transport factor 2 family protein [Acidimicrobiales bacterium]|nr:nuclear transport factor 2 family protein [Acidimicrobiales bacterium]